MSKTQIKSLKLRIQALEEELQTCETRAQYECVWQTLSELDRRLYEAQAAR